MTHPQVFRIALHKDVKVSEIFSQGPQGLMWNLLFSRDPFEWEVELIGKLMDDLNLVYLSNSNEDSQI